MDANPRRRGRGIVEDVLGPAKSEPPFIPLSIINPVELAGKAIIPRRWIVEGWLPVGSVTLLYGDGGTGKTLLAQMLMTCTALGRPWCGLPVRQCRSFGLFCEDDEDELHRRQEDILRATMANYEDLEPMRLASGVGQDNILTRYDRDGYPTLTPRLVEVQKAALAHRAELVVFDNASDTFGGNENDRGQVGNYVKVQLAGLAREINGAVLLLAHPSRVGLSATGDMTSGSTGWNNSARSRWSLSRPIAQDGYPEREGDDRILGKRKANYSSVGEEIRLTWDNGVFTAPDARNDLPAAFAAVSRANRADEVFVTLLKRCAASNLNVSSGNTSSNYAPKLFSKRPDREGIERRDFEAAMHRLFAEERITNEEYGHKGGTHYRIAPVEPGSVTPVASDDEAAILNDWTGAAVAARIDDAAACGGLS